MDYFEQVVVQLLESRGYWARRSVHIDLSKKDKRRLGKPSMPRPEIDVVAYKPGENELVLFEVKSWLDSIGVQYPLLLGAKSGEGRFKLLTDRVYQSIISRKLAREYADANLVLPSPKVRFGLAAGKIRKCDEMKVGQHAKRMKWFFLSPNEIAEFVRGRANQPYANDPVMLAAKLILHNSARLFEKEQR